MALLNSGFFEFGVVITYSMHGTRNELWLRWHDNNNKNGWMVWLCVPDQLCIIRKTLMNVRLGSLKIVVKTKHFVFV